mgnify:FL=1
MMWDELNGKNKPRLFKDKESLDAELKAMYDNYVPKLQEKKVSYKQFMKDLRNAGLKTEVIEVE